MANEIRFDHGALEAGLAGVQDSLNSLITRAVDGTGDSAGLDADTVAALRRAVDSTTTEMRRGDEDAETTRSGSRSAEEIAETVAREIQRISGPETGLSSAGGGGAAPSPSLAQAAQAQQMQAQQAQQSQQMQAQQMQAQQMQAQQSQQAQQMASARQTMQMQQAQAQAQQMQQAQVQQAAASTLGQTTSGGGVADKLAGLTGADGDVDKEALREAIYEALKEQDEAEGGEEGEEGSDDRGVIDDNQLYEDESAGRAIELAQEFAAEGLPYVWGGGHGAEPGPTGGGLDCSGMTRDFIHQWKGIDINGTSETMAQSGVAVPDGEQQPGDLWFPYDSGTPPGHVGVYIGNGQVLEAQTTGTNVGIFDERPGFFRRVE